ncbi:EAL domain-containing protein, partial [Stenotrophomonas maltophilia]|uniref:EAL domain-containing protein n=2 Tax=Pseudomonadota TaxID=1224 RepID=UPI0013DC3FFB
EQEIRPVNGVLKGNDRRELLLRLRDESGALVPPGSFLPAAERYGLMPLIDRWVVRRAFEIIAERKHH